MPNISTGTRAQLALTMPPVPFIKTYKQKIINKALPKALFIPSISSSIVPKAEIIAVKSTKKKAPVIRHTNSEIDLPIIFSINLS